MKNLNAKKILCLVFVIMMVATVFVLPTGASSAYQTYVYDIHGKAGGRADEIVCKAPSKSAKGLYNDDVLLLLDLIGKGEKNDANDAYRLADYFIYIG